MIPPRTVPFCPFPQVVHSPKEPFLFVHSPNFPQGTIPFRLFWFLGPGSPGSQLGKRFTSRKKILRRTPTRGDFYLAKNFLKKLRRRPTPKKRFCGWTAGATSSLSNPQVRLMSQALVVFCMWIGTRQNPFFEIFFRSSEDLPHHFFFWQQRIKMNKVVFASQRDEAEPCARDESCSAELDYLAEFDTDPLPNVCFFFFENIDGSC